MIKKILLGLLVVLVLIQFIRIDKTNPERDASKNIESIEKVPTEVLSLLQSACYDCHSYTTKYPWYSNIAPVSWLLKDHIDDGRKHLNFDEWASYTRKKQLHKIEEIKEEMQEGEMPIRAYEIWHPEAQLTDEQKNTIYNWVSETLANQ